MRFTERRKQARSSPQPGPALMLLLALSSSACDHGSRSADRGASTAPSQAPLAAEQQTIEGGVAHDLEPKARAPRAAVSSERLSANKQSSGTALADASAGAATSRSAAVDPAQAWLGDAGCVTVQRCPGVPGPCKRTCVAFPEPCRASPNCACLSRVLCGHSSAGFCRRREVQCFQP